jgi:dipeptidyl-peptidase 4
MKSHAFRLLITAIGQNVRRLRRFSPGPVAQSSTLLYRRGPLGKPPDEPQRPMCSHARRTGSPRYSRVELCATSVAVVPGLCLTLFALTLGICGAEPPDPSLLTVDRIFGTNEFKTDDWGPARWLKDGTGYTTLEPAEGFKETKEARDLVRYEPGSGQRRVQVPASKLVPRGETLPLKIEDYAWSDDAQRLLIFTNSKRVWRQATRGDYWVLDLKTGTLNKLGGKAAPATLMFATFSPDGRRVAYVREHNLYVQTLDNLRVTQLTRDGSETIINGTSDWVNEEEFGLRNGFRWSPDGKRIAYWQFDTSGVGQFKLINNTASLYPKVTSYPYPKAGQTNSACRVGVVRAGGGRTTWLHPTPDPRNHYIPVMEWARDSSRLLFQRLNRLQNTNEVLAADPGSGAARLLFTDRDDAWVDAVEDWHWVCRGQRFLWLSEREGWRHLYTVRSGSAENRQNVGAPAEHAAERRFVTGFGLGSTQSRQDVGAPAENAAERRFATGFGSESTQSRQNVGAPDGPITLLTPGAFDVISVAGIDEQQGWVYFIAAPDNPTQRRLYRVSLDGRGEIVPVSPQDQPGTHSYDFSKDGRWAFHTWSRFGQPPVIDLVRLPAHSSVRVLADNSKLKAKLAQLKPCPSEFFRVEIGQGTQLDAWCIKPPGFDPAKRYPVLFHVYGEPAGQTVADRWGGDNYLWHCLLAQQGYLVMSVDNRGTAVPRGRAWRKCIYRQVGILASADQAAAVRRILEERPYADPKRIGIWGWSGGGSMTLNAVFRYPDLYQVGMAVAFVSNERYYDTIYQERYMGLPAGNEAGYRNGSPITFAGQLQGRLLLVYGTGDDNCHYQNCEALINELVKQNKPFSLLAYPNRTHAIKEGDNTRRHLYEMLTRYLKEHLPAGPPSP